MVADGRGRRLVGDRDALAAVTPRHIGRPLAIREDRFFEVKVELGRLPTVSRLGVLPPRR
jgi:hypothetical protein